MRWLDAYRVVWVFGQKIDSQAEVCEFLSEQAPHVKKSHECWIEPSLEKPLRLLGFEAFESWMRCAEGESVSRGRSGDVVRLNIGGEAFFLKRRHGESPMAMIGMLLHGHRPLGGAMREVRMLEQLSSCGFDVMQAAAYGERRRWGLPYESFLLARAVTGESAAGIYQNVGPMARRDLMQRIGMLTGQLHAAGFFDHLRPKDLIVEPDGTLTLIDRECRHPWPKRFSRRHALRAIARTVRRTLRDGLRFGPATARAFLNGYRDGVGPKWRPSPEDLRKRMFRQIRGELGR